MKRMNTTIGLTVLTLMAFTLLPVSAYSIDKGTSEIGFDGVLEVTSFTGRQTSFTGRFRTRDNVVEFRMPSKVRYGMFTGADTEFEFMVNFVSSHQERTDVTVVEIMTGFAFHPSGKSVGAIGFIEPMVGFRLVDISSSSDLQIIAGAETGFKLVNDNGLALRLSAKVSRAFETARSFGATTIGFNFGLSLFIKQKDFYSN